MTGPTHVAIAAAATLAVASTGKIPPPDALGWVAVVVGSLERERYPAPSLDKFGQFMTPAFQSGDVIIYQR